MIKLPSSESGKTNLLMTQQAFKSTFEVCCWGDCSGGNWDLIALQLIIGNEERNKNN